MQAYNVPLLGRILFSSVLVFFLSYETVGADISKSPHPDQSSRGPTLLKAKEVELPASSCCAICLS